MQILRPFDQAITIAVSQKQDGNMGLFGDEDEAQLNDILNNRRALLDALKITSDQVLHVRLTYDREDYCRFLAIDAPSIVPMPTDGVLTTNPNLAILITPADCLILITYDSVQKSLMLTHCGRHGVEDYAARRAIEFMQEHGSDPTNIHAWLSPSAGKDGYPIWKFDNKSMQEIVVEQLLSAAVPQTQVARSNIDTTTDSNYFSHSQGDTRARFAVMARINP